MCKYAKIVAGVTTLNKKAKNLTKLADKPVECWQVGRKHVTLNIQSTDYI